MVTAVAQRMVIMHGTVFRVKHVSKTGTWLFFQADGIEKLDKKLYNCFTAENKRPIRPYLWQENDLYFVNEHLK
jgi:hypothetical protein